MTTRFTKIEPAAGDHPEPPKPRAILWIAPASKSEVEEQLFYFLCSLRDRRPQAARPLLVENATLRALYADPHPDLIEVLRHCVDSLLVELGPDPACWGEFSLSPALLGVALAVYTGLLPPLTQSEEVVDPLISFGAALVATLPPARRLPELLAYHALLRGAARNLPYLPADRAGLIHTLLDRSPLCAVYHLHWHTPPPLTSLAAELLPGWERKVISPVPWRNLDDWLDTLAPALAQPAIAGYLRRRWLNLPETRSACRNLGLLLEALRRRGDGRACILEFYEAYDRFCATTMQDAWRRPVRCWPLLDRIERLLRAAGDSEAAIRLNRWGNEYFLKFRALLQIVITEGGLPHDLNLLTFDFINALRPLLEWTSEDQAVPGPDWGAIEFAEGDRQ